MSDQNVGVGSEHKRFAVITSSTTYLVINIALAILIIVVIAAILSGTIMLAVVEGISMEPLLQTGDVVFVVKTSPSQIKVGDVIVYHRYGGGFIIHRVIEIRRISPTTTGLVFITKGDNNPYPDPPVPASQVVGKVVSIGHLVIKIPALGVISLWFKSILRH